LHKKLALLNQSGEACLLTPFDAMLVTQRCGLPDVRTGLHTKAVPEKLAWLTGVPRSEQHNCACGATLSFRRCTKLFEVWQLHCMVKVAQGPASQ